MDTAPLELGDGDTDPSVGERECPYDERMKMNLIEEDIETGVN